MTRSIIFVIILIAVATCVMAGGESFDAEACIAELEVEAGCWRSLCILLGFTTAGGVLFMLFTLFGNPPVIGS